MALVLRNLFSFYSYCNDEVSDPRVQDWFLMSSPIPGTCLLVLYLCFVLKWGPKFMENRKPYNVDNFIKVYNFVQVFVCAYLFEEGLRLGYMRDYSLICQPVDFTTDPVAVAVARRCHMYFLLKVIDLLDTVFFVLRKKQNQISFLHVYHHTGMVMLTWSGVKWFAGGHSIFMGFINCLVHVVMYFYYFLTSVSPQYKANVWWKKYITQMQIIQFGLIFLHWISLVFQPNCDYPKWPVFIVVPQNLFMFLLFFDFYYRTYIRTKKVIPNEKEELPSSTDGGDTENPDDRCNTESNSVKKDL